MTPPAFIITGFRVIARPFLLSEATVLATMVLHYGGLMIHGAFLARHDHGTYCMLLPHVHKDCRVAVRNRDQYEQLLHLAVATYRAVTGCDADATQIEETAAAE